MMRIENGLPIEDNASDKQDSVRLAAICRVFRYDHEIAQFFDMRRYLLPTRQPIPLRDEPFTNAYFDKDLIVRSPDEYKFDLSRDQWICFVAAAPKDLIDRKYVNGVDIMSPTVSGHEKRCKGEKASLWEDIWLWGDMIAHAKFTPLKEPNQILIMAKKAGKLKQYCWLNPKWRKALRSYWIDTRAKPEVELCEHIIAHIELEIKRCDED